MTNLTLTGTEVLQVLPQQANGQPAATTGQTTTAAIAALTSGQIGGDVLATNTSPFTITNTVSLLPITGLTVNLTNSATYQILCGIGVNCTGGAGVALSLGGTVTASSLNVAGIFNAQLGQYIAQTTALNSAIGTTSPVVFAELAGVIQTNAAGTLTINAGQQAANAASTTIQSLGFLDVTRIA